VSKAWPVQDLDGNGPILDNARRVLAVRIAELYSYAPVIAYPEYSEALHDMRIAAKRLRYSLELFRDQLGKPGARQIERIKALQEELGTLHDHDVRIALIEDELAVLATEQSALTNAAISAAEVDQIAAITASALRPAPDDPRRGLLALLGREHAGRRATYIRFRELWDRLGQEGMRADLVSLSTLPLPTNLSGRDTR
jgi:hypothetical protein